MGRPFFCSRGRASALSRPANSPEQISLDGFAVLTPLHGLPEPSAPKIRRLLRMQMAETVGQIVGPKRTFFAILLVCPMRFHISLTLSGEAQTEMSFVFNLLSMLAHAVLIGI
jgi:hypothetical protein